MAKNYFLTFKDILLNNIQVKLMEFSLDVNNTHMEGSVSQIIYFSSSFLFYVKKSGHFLTFF